MAALEHGFSYFAESPKPSLLTGVVTDGGLLTISRYPITGTEFHPFQTPMVESDGLAYKGILYTKININNGQHLHLFQTHLQASYYANPIPLYVETYVSRYENLKEARSFITRKLDQPKNFESRKDLVLLAGDFNQNGGKLNLNQLAKIAELKKDPLYAPIMPMFLDEYCTMIKALQSPDWEVIDCMMKHHGKLHITLGDTHTHEDGTPTCKSPVLTNKDDSMSRQTLDYIFQIRSKSKLVEPGMYKVDWAQTKVEQFPAKEEFLFCSDHFGISTCLN
jgi:hypothetical protein